MPPLPPSLSCSVEDLRSASTAFGVEAANPEETGRYIVTFRPETTPETARMLADSASLRVAHATDFGESAVSFDALTAADALVLPEIGIALVSAEPAQMEKFGIESADTGVLAVEPERFVYAFATPRLARAKTMRRRSREAVLPSICQPAAASYLRGYRDALSHLTDSLLGSSAAAAEAVGLQPDRFQGNRVHLGIASHARTAFYFTGNGIRVAVLDTGFDLNHPDFLSRPKVTSSFVPGQLCRMRTATVRIAWALPVDRKPRRRSHVTALPMRRRCISERC